MADVFRQKSSPDLPELVDAGCVRIRRLGNGGASGPLQSKDRSGYRCDDQRQLSRSPNVVSDITSGVSADVHRERGEGDRRRSTSWSEDDSVDVIKAEAYRQAVLATRSRRPVSPWHPSPLGVSGEGSGGWHGRCPDNDINSSEIATSQSNSPLTSPKKRPNLMVLSEASGKITEVYNIKQKIGEGHSGIVNVVENRSTGDLFACKSLNKKRMKVRESEGKEMNRPPPPLPNGTSYLSINPGHVRKSSSASYVRRRIDFLVCSYLDSRTQIVHFLLLCRLVISVLESVGRIAFGN